MTEISGGSSQRIPELDGLRGLAILLVVLWHYLAPVPHGSTGGLTDYAWRSLRLTWSGVDLFFVLSGFLIGGILLDHRSAPRYFQTFYRRRAWRILPLYGAWLGLFYALPALLPALRRWPGIESLFAHPLPAWSYLTFTQNLAMAARGNFGAGWLGITWSLAIEEHFYLVLPLMVRWIPVRRLPLWLAAIELGGLVARLLAGPLHHNAVYVLTPTRADSLIAGVLCAYLLRQERWRQLVVRGRPALHALVTLSLVGLLGLSLFRHYGFEGSPYLFLVVAGLYGGLLLLAVTPGGGPVPWLARRRWLRELGIVAYGVYLTHQTVNSLLHGFVLGRPPSLATGAGVVVTIAAALVTWSLATLSWRTFERPLVARGRRLDYDDAGGDAAPASATGRLERESASDQPLVAAIAGTTLALPHHAVDRQR